MRFADVRDNANPQSFNPSAAEANAKRSPNVLSSIICEIYKICLLILQAIDLIRTDPRLVPYFPSNGYVTLAFGLPNFPTEFVEPSIIQDAEILIEMPYNTKNVSANILDTVISLYSHFLFLQIDIHQFNLTILPCQAGFALRKQSNGLVECDCVYNKIFFYDAQVISCNKDTQEIILAVGEFFCIVICGLFA